jgi:hypothetical protein
MNGTKKDINITPGTQARNPNGNEPLKEGLTRSPRDGENISSSDMLSSGGCGAIQKELAPSVSQKLIYPARAKTCALVSVHR